MPGPWEKYQTESPPSSDGPWSKYQAPAAKPEGVRKWADAAADKVEAAGSAVMDGPVGKAIHWVGDKFERYVDAPFRAGVTATNDPNVKNIYEMWGRVGEQFGEKPLPTTKSGKELMAATGLPTTPLSDVIPGAYTDDGRGITLQRGGIADPSPAGVAGVMIQPSTFAIPGEAAFGALGKVGGKVAQGTAAVAEKYAGPLARTLDQGAGLAKKGVFKVGEKMTGGNLNAEKAFNASERLSGAEMLAPDAFTGKAGKAVGAARDAIPETTIAPGSRQALEKVKTILTDAEKRALRTPQSTAVLEKIDGLLASGDDIPLQTVDDLVRNLDSVGWTQQGNKRVLEPMWGGPVSEARRTLNELLPATPEGAALQGAKSKFADLATAQGRQGSRLRGIMSYSEAAHGVGLGLATGNPVIAAATVAASRVIAPRTYFQIVGMAKLPKSAVNALMESYSTGKVGAIQDTLAGLAEKYPEEIARLTTTLANYSEESARAVADQKDDAVKRRIKRMGE